MKSVFMRRSLLVLVTALLLGTGVDLAHPTLAPAPAHAAPPPALLAGDSIADVVERVLPSVVNVSTTKASGRRGPSAFDPFFNDPGSPFHGQPPGGRYASSLGSGVIVSADGYVLTNSHVVSGGEGIRVSLADGRELEATIVGNDPKSDLAVLRLQGELGKLVPIRFGNASDTRLGDVVLAIGNPFGVGQAVTMGIISAKGRSGMGIVDYEDFIQTDAAINPGNSGGALVNMQGELIGINTAILSRTGGYQGIGFAIPTDMARPIMDSLIQSGTVDRGWLGVRIQTLTTEMAKSERLPTARGVLVADVLPNSPAARAGLRKDDVIVRIDGKDTPTASHLSTAVAMSGANKTVRLELVRRGKSRALRVELGDLSKVSY